MEKSFFHQNYVQPVEYDLQVGKDIIEYSENGTQKGLQLKERVMEERWEQKMKLSKCGCNCLVLFSKQLWNSFFCPTSIVFHKTHKTASTSIQNIMLRLVVNKNLTILMPKDPEAHEFFDQISPTEYIDQGADVHCMHSIMWNFEDMKGKNIVGCHHKSIFQLMWNKVLLN